jgi:hypothetical protein
MTDSPLYQTSTRLFWSWLEFIVDVYGEKFTEDLLSKSILVWGGKKKNVVIDAVQNWITFDMFRFWILINVLKIESDGSINLTVNRHSLRLSYLSGSTAVSFRFELFKVVEPRSMMGGCFGLMSGSVLKHWF